MLGLVSAQLSEIEAAAMQAVTEADEMPKAERALFGGKSLPGVINAGLSALRKIFARFNIDPATMEVPSGMQLIDFLIEQVKMLPNPVLRSLILFALNWIKNRFSPEEVDGILRSA